MGFIDHDNIAISAFKDYQIERIEYSELQSILTKDHVCVGCTVYLPAHRATLQIPIQRSGLRAEVVSPGKSVDGRLIFDTLVNAHSDNFDVAVISSGDKDYIPVINELKKLKKDVIIVAFKSSLGPAMRNAGTVIELDNYISQLTMNSIQYTCPDCGKKLYLNKTPYEGYLCRTCYLKKKQNTSP